MKADIYTIEGKKSGSADLPGVFSGIVRNDMIKRAVLSDLSENYQPKSNDPRAGMETSARYRGRKEDFGSIKNHGISKLPREVLPGGKFGKVKRIPSAVKGRRAQGPHVEKVLYEMVNKKEYAKCVASAIAATSKSDVVAKRGHKVPTGASLPFIFEDKMESITKTKEIIKALHAIGIGADLARAQKTKIRTGVGARKANKIRAKSALIVVGNDCAALKSAKNIPGVDVRKAENLKAVDLAPGTHAGRLTIYTQSAIKYIGEKFKGA